MLCSKCNSEIPEGNQFCGKCGAVANKKWYQKNSPLTIVIMIVALAFLFFAVFFFVSSGGEDEPDSTTSVTITLSEFNSIENGMTYEQVVQIVGGEGTLLSEVGEKNDELYTVMYSYEGTEVGASANFTFQNNKLIAKAQIGLE